MRYILASASPRRTELIKHINKDTEIIPSSVNEETTKEKPDEIVEELSMRKAQAVFDDVKGDVTVIGADTIVYYNGEILEKPVDAEDAKNMLSLLSDRTHKVFTGVSIIIRNDDTVMTKTFHEKTEVTFYALDRYEIDDYIRTGESFDKAGAYGIQGAFLKHVKCIKGDYCNVVGLPVSRLYEELKSLQGIIKRQGNSNHELA